MDWFSITTDTDSEPPEYRPPASEPIDIPPATTRVNIIAVPNNNPQYLRPISPGIVSIDSETTDGMATPVTDWTEVRNEKNLQTVLEGIAEAQRQFHEETCAIFKQLLQAMQCRRR